MIRWQTIKQAAARMLVSMARITNTERSIRQTGELLESLDEYLTRTHILAKERLIAARQRGDIELMADMSELMTTLADAMRYHYRAIISNDAAKSGDFKDLGDE